jgi:hypothetical protein
MRRKRRLGFACQIVPHRATQSEKLHVCAGIGLIQLGVADQIDAETNCSQKSCRVMCRASAALLSLAWLEGGRIKKNERRRRPRTASTKENPQFFLKVSTNVFFFLRTPCSLGCTFDRHDSSSPHNSSYRAAHRSYRLNHCVFNHDTYPYINDLAQGRWRQTQHKTTQQQQHSKALRTPPVDPPS